METYTWRVYSSNVQTSVQYIHIYICLSSASGNPVCFGAPQTNVIDTRIESRFERAVCRNLR